MTDKPRDKDGYIIYNWKRINAQVAETSRLTDIEHEQHAIETNIRYAVTGGGLAPLTNVLVDRLLKRLLGGKQ